MERGPSRPARSASFSRERGQRQWAPLTTAPGPYFFSVGGAVEPVLVGVVPGSAEASDGPVFT